MRYEIPIYIIDKDYIDTLIVALVRQGHDVYYNEDDNRVCFTMDEGDMNKILEDK